MLDLTWDYPTEGSQDEPSADAVLAEVNGWDADGKPLSSYTQLKSDGSTTCGCWIYCGARADGVNQTARRKPGREQSWVAPEWGWAWQANRRILYNRASADPDGKPWSERKAYVWWDEEQGKWTGHDNPDFVAAGRRPTGRRTARKGWPRSPAPTRSSCRPTGRRGCSSRLGWWTARCRRNASSLTGLYLTYGLFCGIGTGIVYVGIVGLMVRWFPDRRGLATGVVAAGYGFGAILTTFPIDTMMKKSGYQHTLVVFGIILGLIGAVSALALRLPTPEDKLPPPPAMASTVGTPPGEMLRSNVFWLMFVMMTMMSTGGLMIISQFATFSRDFGVANITVFGLAALPLALTFDRITNGLTRPFFGWVSDRIGRENTMAIAFLLEAAP